MIPLLREPLPLPKLALAALFLVGGPAIYCLAYNQLAGTGESVGEAVLWAMVNVLPWLIALELPKYLSLRFSDMPWLVWLAAGLAGGLVISMALGAATQAGWHAGFELTRRLPALVLVALMLVAGRFWLSQTDPAVPTAPADLPVPVAAISRVSAAGNYAELHTQGRTQLVRAPLGAIEAALAPHGFIRVHRSHIVRRSDIVRTRGTDLVLKDGSLLRTGARYRSAI